MRRCHYNLDLSYPYYGGKGIRVCVGWQEFNNFFEWAASKYSVGLTIDRVDGTKGYYPRNCRFVTQAVNNCNRGKQVNNTSGYVGVTYRKAENSWEARIRYRRKAIQLGRFASAEEAVQARNAHIVEHGLPFPIQRVG